MGMMEMVPPELISAFDQSLAMNRQELRRKIEATRELLAMGDEEMAIAVLVMQTGLTLLQAAPPDLTTHGTMYALALIELAKQPKVDADAIS
jgi:hypothetical protein